MKRRDWLIVGVVAVLSLALLLLRPGAVNPLQGEVYLRVSAPGQAFDLIPLTQAREVVIDQADGSHNVVEVFAGGFRMKESNCHNQDCVHQGDVTQDNIASRPLANQIICLPHKVVLELVTGAGDVPEINS
jgi:hypothetical protein